MISFEDLKRARDEADARAMAASKALNSLPKLTNGLTPDHIKFSPEFRALRAAYAAAHEETRKLNRLLTKHYKAEVRRDFEARRLARLAR